MISCNYIRVTNILSHIVQAKLRILITIYLSSQMVPSIDIFK